MSVVAAAGIAKKAGTGIKKASQNKPLMTALGVGFAFYAGKQVYENIRKKQVENLVTSDINVQHAMQIRDAVKSLSVSSRTTILNIARQGINATEVARRYQTLYGRSMYDDLRRKLSESQYSEFLTLIRTKSSGGSSSSSNATSSTYSDTANKQKYIVVTNKTSAYDDPRFYPIGGKVKRVDEKTVIYGSTTGKVYTMRTVFGEKKFYQIAVKTETGNAKSIYVDKDDILLVSKTDLARYASYPLVKFYDRDF